MKKNKSLILILILLLAATGYFIYRSSDTTIRTELKDFAVKDTSAITKIFLADRNGNQVSLERNESGKWIMNGQYEPKQDLLKILLDAIYQVQIKTRVANAAYNNIIKMLASTGIKCEIYLNREAKPAKIYYVGGHTEDATGTFMMLENSSVPFVTEIPGFTGYLTPRYNPGLEAWKTPRLFKLNPEEIKEVSVNYTYYPEKSFSIQSEAGKYHVASPLNGQLKHVDSVAVDNYLAFFRNVYYESKADKVSDMSKDSMLQSQPSVTISVMDVKNERKEIDIYPMPISTSSLSQQDSLGNPLKYDLDRMFGFVKPEKEFVVLQHYTFDVLLRQLSDFDAARSKASRKK